MDRPMPPAADPQGPAASGPGPSDHRAPVRALRAATRPTVAWTECLGGLRVSTVVRPDGTAFTVRVPVDRVGDEKRGEPRTVAFEPSWIVDHGPYRPPSNASLFRLASAVAAI